MWYFRVLTKGTNKCMQKKGLIQRSNDPKTACIVQKVSELRGVTPRYVRMVRDGQRKNEKVFTTYMDLQEGFDSVIKSAKELVQFEKVSLKKSKNQSKK